MLVATPGQTTAYSSTIHNNNNNNSNNNNSSSSNNAGGGVGGNSTAAATASSTKKSNSLNSTNTTTSATPKSLNNNNNHSTAVVSNKNSSASYNYHTNPKHDSLVSHKLLQQNNKMTATSSRETISSSLTAAATTHSLKNENSTNNTNTNTTNSNISTNTTTTATITSTNTHSSTSKQQNFIQTLKDSVQKALISTSGSTGHNSSSQHHQLSIAPKLSASTNCNNLTTSIHNVTSSSAAASHKVSTTSTTSSNSTAAAAATATQPPLSASSSSSSSVSLVRSKYFSCSLSKLHTVAPTIIHRYPEERQHASSTDSLQKEMCHFKPIRIVPTTPWKSGSKSRGNSLRFPKANLATKKSEFVLKSNCDVNNRKKKQQQQNRTQTDKINLDENDDNEQENKEFHGIYKPKPSLTCLSTSVTTPNHQSAFVCLVAQMKSLVNLQSKKQLSPVKTAAGKEAGNNNEPIKELYVRKKPANRKSLAAQDIELPKELPKSRRTLNKRVTNNITTNNNNKTTILNTSKENVKRTNAKSTNNNNSISKTSTAAITKAKSRRKLGRAKSKTINMVKLASTRGKGKLQNSVSMPAVMHHETATGTTSKRTRKRKLEQEDETTTSPSKTASSKSLALGARKSTRLSKDTNNSTYKSFKSPITQTNLKTTSQRTRKNSTTVVCFSPPLTRSRLKHLAEQGKILKTNPTETETKTAAGATKVKKRRI